MLGIYLEVQETLEMQKTLEMLLVMQKTLEIYVEVQKTPEIRDPRNAKDARNLFSSNANKSPYKCKRR